MLRLYVLCKCFTHNKSIILPTFGNDLSPQLERDKNKKEKDLRSDQLSLLYACNENCELNLNELRELNYATYL